MSGSSLQHTVPTLPASILSDLYPDTLISMQGEASSSPAHAATVEKKHIAGLTDTLPSSLGENRKGIIIAVDYPDAATIRESDLTFLLNILNACKLGLRDVVILNLHGLPDASKQQLQHKYPATVFMMFGMSAADISLPVRFPDYQRQTFDGIQYLSAPSLSRLEQDAQGKKQLWACLKAIFLNG